MWRKRAMKTGREEEKKRRKKERLDRGKEIRRRVWGGYVFLSE